MTSVTGLHLQYRLWIAEMNADITYLRIFDDYLAEFASANTSADSQNAINSFKDKSCELRKEMDDLRHEMHLVKLKLGSLARTSDNKEGDVEKEINHEELKKRYEAFRRSFQKTKEDLQTLANNE